MVVGKPYLEGLTTNDKGCTTLKTFWHGISIENAQLQLP